MDGEICSVSEVALVVWRVGSIAPPAPPYTPSSDFLYILRGGLCLAVEKMRLNGETEWISLTIEVQALLAVTYGSYLREVYLTMCSAAFILECDQGRRGRLVGFFPEKSLSTNAYRGQL